MVFLKLKANIIILFKKRKEKTYGRQSLTLTDNGLSLKNLNPSSGNLISRFQKIGQVSRKTQIISSII